jgi:hypothetical protein
MFRYSLNCKAKSCSETGPVLPSPVVELVLKDEFNIRNGILITITKNYTSKIEISFVSYANPSLARITLSFRLGFV